MSYNQALEPTLWTEGLIIVIGVKGIVSGYVAARRSFVVEPKNI